MKKTMRLLITLLLTMTLLVTIAIPAFARENDNDFDDWKTSIQDQQKEMLEDMEEQQDQFDKQYNKIKKTQETMTAVIFAIFIPLFGFGIYCIVDMFVLSSKSMDTRQLPSRKRTVNTITAPMPDKKVCTRCGRPFGEEAFCPTCGVPKKTPTVFEVPIQGKMTAQKLEQYLNDWLAENPYIYDCQIQLDYRTSLLSPLVGYKFFVKKAIITCQVSDKPQAHQYGFAFLYRFRFFGPIGYNEEKHVAQWNANNPNCQVLWHKGSHIQHFDNQGGFYAQYYNYVLYKKPVA